MLLRIFQKGFNFSQDGPGNRLVYHLQGCNLRCPWCSNPEGLALSGGTEYSVDELVEEVQRSRMMFFDGGGVTLTGGEVTLQFEPVKTFLTKLHQLGIHTCIETNGISHRLPELFPVLDLLIMDVKHYDSELHYAVTGTSNLLTLDNLKAALAHGQALALRIPLIGGVNASPSDAQEFAKLFSRLEVGNRATIELLSYHEYGKDKYTALQIPYTMTSKAKITKSQLNLFSQTLEAAGLTIIHT